jgi:hypothetical protein
MLYGSVTLKVILVAKDSPVFDDSAGWETIIKSSKK